MINIDGKGSFGQAKQISSSGGKLNIGQDVDADGDMDIITTSSSSIYWIENINGDGSEWNTNELTSFSSGAPYGFKYIEDIDGDGDLDLANNYMLWYENINGQYLLSEEKLLFDRPEEYDISRSIHPTDWDNDGDQDIIMDVGIEINKSHIYLLENDGNQNFNPIILKDSVASVDALTFSELADVDMDGDMDLVVHNGPNDVGWYRNDEGQLSDFIFIHEYFDFPGEMKIVDIDNDEDLDVFWCGHPGIFWKENIGGFTFEESVNKIGSQGIDATDDIIFGDIDGDGDLDILDLGRTIGNFSQDIRWHENKLKIISPTKNIYSPRISIFPNPAIDFIQINQKGALTTIYNLEGKKMISTRNHSVDISRLNSGIYFVEISIAGEIHFEKMIVY